MERIGAVYRKIVETEGAPQEDFEFLRSVAHSSVEREEVDAILLAANWGRAVPSGDPIANTPISTCRWLQSIPHRTSCRKYRSHCKAGTLAFAESQWASLQLSSQAVAEGVSCQLSDASSMRSPLKRLPHKLHSRSPNARARLILKWLFGQLSAGNCEDNSEPPRRDMFPAIQATFENPAHEAIRITAVGVEC
jgi:hypothetical protein